MLVFYTFITAVFARTSDEQFHSCHEERPTRPEDLAAVDACYRHSGLCYGSLGRDQNQWDPFDT